MNGSVKGVWHFDGQHWVERKGRLAGLNIDGRPVLTQQGQRDRGVRLRDLDQDGRCELIVGNESQNAAFTWSQEEESWKTPSLCAAAGSVDRRCSARTMDCALLM